MVQVRALNRGFSIEKQRKAPPWRIVLLVAFIGGLLFWSLNPAKQWLQQQREMAGLQKKIDTLRKENKAFKEEIARLKTESYVEQVARKELGLVKPGETAYVVISPSEQEDLSSKSKLPSSKENKDEVTWWQRVISFFKRIL